MNEVRLRRGRAKPLWAGHPRLLSGAIEAVTGTPAAGDVVLVLDHDGRAIGRGFFAPASPVRVTMLTRDAEEVIDAEFFRRRVRRAVAVRRSLGLPSADTTAYRLVHSDGDGLPGVVVDRFEGIAVVQLSVRGMEDRRAEIAAALAEEAGVESVVLRPVPAFARAEELTGAEGDLLPTPAPKEVEIRENGVRYLVRPREGQKTGHFLDHRENRRRFASMIEGRTVLDAFAGTGGFALAAALGGAAEVQGVESSSEAITAAESNAERNGVADRVRFQRGDVFRTLRDLETEGRTFDAIVLDPPRMAARRREKKAALRGYKELNLRAMRLLSEGGILATASCTGVVSEEEFERVLRDAALDARRALVVLARGGQGPDHPWTIAAPEGRYLKFVLGLVFRL